MVKLISALATCIAAASATMMEQMAQSSYWQGGNLMASGSASISLSVGITIVAVNNGGGSKWQQVNNYQGKMGKTIEVTVGGTAGLVYSPSTINAEIGDIVQFNFMSKNHTVTQSTFPVPCKKMDGGMDSGFMPNMMDGTPPPAFKMQVMKKDPLWFYCRQKTPTSHCGKGMVFSINPTADKSQASFLAAAIAQNGTAAAGSMAAAAGTMMTTAAAGGSTIVAPPASAATMMAAAPPPPPPPPPPPMAPPAAVAAAPPPSMVEGQGSAGSSGSCSCSCLCGISSYPSGMGLGMYGGMSGAMPMPAS